MLGILNEPLFWRTLLICAAISFLLRSYVLGLIPAVLFVAYGVQETYFEHGAGWAIVGLLGFGLVTATGGAAGAVLGGLAAAKIFKSARHNNKAAKLSSARQHLSSDNGISDKSAGRNVPVAEHAAKLEALRGLRKLADMYISRNDFELAEKTLLECLDISEDDESIHDALRFVRYRRSRFQRP